MSNNNDFYVKFDSNATTWAAQLEAELRPARKVVTDFQAELLEMQGKAATAGKVAQAALALGNQLPAPGKTPPATPPSKTPPPTPAGKNPPPPAQPQPQLQTTLGKIDISSLQQAVYEHEDALKETRTHLATTITALRKLPDEMKSVLRSIKASAENERRANEGVGPSVIPGEKNFVKNGTPGSVVVGSDLHRVNQIVRKLDGLTSRTGASLLPTGAGPSVPPPSIADISRATIDKANFDRVILAIRAQTRVMQSGLPVRGSLPTPPTTNNIPAGSAPSAPTTRSVTETPAEKSATSAPSTAAPLSEKAQEAQNASDLAEVRQQLNALSAHLAGTNDLDTETRQALEDTRSKMSARVRALEREETGLTRADQSAQAKADFAASRTTLTDVERDERNRISTLLDSVAASDFSERAEKRADARNGNYSVGDLQEMALAYQGQGVDVPFNSRTTKKELSEALLEGRKQYSELYPGGNPALETRGAQIIKTTKIADETAAILGDLDQVIRERRQALDIRGADIRSGGAKDEPFRGAREFGATTIDDDVPTPLSRGVGGSPAEVRRAQAILSDRSAEPEIRAMVKEFAVRPDFDPFSVPRPVIGDRQNQDEMDRGMAAVTRLRDVQKATLEIDKLGRTFFALRSRIQESTEFIDRANSRLNRAAEMGVPTGNAMRQALDDGTLNRNAVALAGLKGMEEKLVTDQSNIDKTRTAMPEFRAELRDMLSSDPYLASQEYRQAYDKRNVAPSLPEGVEGPLGPVGTYLRSVQKTMEATGSRSLADSRLLRESVARTIAGSRQVVGGKDLYKPVPGLQYTNNRFTMAEGLSKQDDEKLNNAADKYGRALEKVTRVRNNEYSSVETLIEAEEKLERRANAFANQIERLANGLSPSLRTLVGEEKYNEDGSRVADQRVPDERILADESRRQYARDLAEQERNRSFRTPESEVRTGELAIASAQERLAEAIAQRAVAQERYAAQERALVAGADGNPDPKKVNALSRVASVQQDMEQVWLDTDRLKDIRNQVEDPNNFRAEPVYDGLHNHGPKSTIEGSIADFDESIRRLSAKRELLDAERNVRDPKKPNQDLLDPQAADKLDRDIARATSLRDQLKDIQTRVGSGRMTDLIENLEGRSNLDTGRGTLDVAQQDAGRVLGGASKVEDLGKAYNNLAAMDREIQKMEASLADTEDKLKKSRAALEKSGDTETKKAAAETKSNVVTQESIKANNDRIAVLRKEQAALRAEGLYKAADKKRLYNDGAGAEDPEYLAVKKRYDRLSQIGKEISSLSRANLTDAEAERKAALRKKQAEIRAEGPYTGAQKKELYKQGGAEDPEYLAAVDRFNRIAAINKEIAAFGKGGDAGGGSVPPGGTGASGAASESGDSSRSLLAQILGQLKSIHATMKSGGMKVTNSVAARATELAETNAAGKISSRSQTATDQELRAAGAGPYANQGRPTEGPEYDAAVEAQRRRASRIKTSDIVKAKKAAEDIVEAQLKKEQAAIEKSQSALRDLVREEEKAELASSRLSKEVQREIAVLKQLTQAANQASTAEERLATARAVAKQQTRVAGVVTQNLRDQNVLAPDRREAIGTVLNNNGPKINSTELDSILQSARNNPEFQRLGTATGTGFGEDMGDGMLDGFARVFGGGSSFMSRVVNTTGTFLVRNFAAGAVFGLTTQLQMVLEQAIQAEATFVRVSAALEATGKETGNIRADLQGIASEYGTNLNDVYTQAAGLSGLFSNAEDLAAGTKIAAQLQIISGGAVSATEAIGVLASTLSAFEQLPGDTNENGKLLPSGLEGAQKVADILTSVQNNLGVNIEIAAEGMARIAGLAKQMQISAEEAAVFTGQVAKQTNQTGAAAGEQLSRILSNLQTGRGRQAVLSAYEDTSPEIAGQIVAGDYGAVVETMIGGFDNLTDAQKRNLTSTVAGARQAASFNALMNNSTGTLNALTAARLSEGDATDRMSKLTDTLNNRLARFGTNVQGLVSNLIQSGLLNFFGLVLVVSNGVLEVINGILNTANKFADSNPLLSWLRDAIGLALGAGLAFKVLGSGVSSVKGIMAQTRDTAAKRQELLEKQTAARQPAPTTGTTTPFARQPYAPGPIRRNPTNVEMVNGRYVTTSENQRGAYLTRGVGRVADATIGRGIGAGTAGVARGFNVLSTKLKPLNAEVSGLRTVTASASRHFGTLIATSGAAVEKGVNQFGRGGLLTNAAVTRANTLAERADVRRAEAQALRDTYADQERYSQITGRDSDVRQMEFRNTLLSEGNTPDEIARRTQAPDERLLTQAKSMDRAGASAERSSGRMGKLATNLGSLASMGLGADVAMVGLAVVLASVGAAMSRSSQAAAEFRENFDKSFGGEGGGAKSDAEIEAANFGPNYQASMERLNNYTDQNWFSKQFTIAGGQLTNGWGNIFNRDVAIQREVGLGENGEVLSGQQDAKALSDKYLEQIRGIENPSIEAIEEIQAASSAEVQRMAQEIQRSDKSDEQKAAAAGQLEMARTMIEEAAADVIAVANGIQGTMNLASDNIKGINDAFAALESTRAMGTVGGMDMSALYADIIDSAALEKDSGSKRILEELASGNADSVDFAIAEGKLLREQVIALNATWQSRIEEGADPADIDAAKSDLLGALSQLGASTDGTITALQENADLIAQQQLNEGDFAGAMRTYARAMERADKIYNRMTREIRNAAVKTGEAYNSIYNDAKELDALMRQAPGADKDLGGLLLGPMAARSRQKKPLPRFMIPEGGYDPDDAVYQEGGELEQYAPPRSYTRQKIEDSKNANDPNSKAAKEEAAKNDSRAVAELQKMAEFALAEATRAIRLQIAKAVDPAMKAALESELAGMEKNFFTGLNAGKAVGGLPAKLARQVGDAAVSQDQLTDSRVNAAQAEIAYAEAQETAAEEARAEAAAKRQAAADVTQAQLGVQMAYAESQDNSVKAARIEVQMARAMMAAAQAEKAAAVTSEERTAARIAVLSAQAQIIGAEAAVVDTVESEAAEARQNAADLRQAQLGIAAAYADARGDAVQGARIQVAMGRAQMAAARAELAAAGTASEQAAARVLILQAQAQIIAGVAAGQAAQGDLVQSQYEVSIALAEAAGNTVLAAERTLGAARTALRQAMSKSKGKATAEVNAARAEAIRAEAAARDARLQDDLDTIDFNLEMGKITQSSAISALQEIVRTRDLTKEQRRQLLLQIKGMKDEMADSQWNFGDIRMPTPYQMRRYISERRDQFRRELDMASGANTNLGGAGGGMVTNNGGNTNTTNVEITINGADTEKVKRLIQDVVGGGRSLNRTTGARRGR